MEKRLTEVACAILDVAEARLRAHIDYLYQHRLNRRQQKRDEIERRRVEAELERQKAIDDHHESNLANLRRLAIDHLAAVEIRNFVAAVKSHPDSAGKLQNEFRDWEGKVNAFANTIDPLSHPLGDIFSAYQPLPEDLKE